MKSKQAICSLLQNWILNACGMRARFLAQLEAVTPWSALAAAIAPFYPPGRGSGAPADRPCADAAYGRGTAVLWAVGCAHGCHVDCGAAVDQERRPGPRSMAAKKGQQWHLGMKAHIGVDADSDLVHTLVTTPANVHDVTQAPALLHGRERYADGDAGIRVWTSACQPTPPFTGAWRCVPAGAGHTLAQSIPENRPFFPKVGHALAPSCPLRRFWWIDQRFIK